MKLIKKGYLLAVLGLILGVAGTAAFQTYAQTNDVTASTTDQAESGWTEMFKSKGHAPLGGDGNITAINGNIITMQEEADEGGGIYTIDADQATITANGVDASISDLKVGNKIFVQGDTNGNNITATTISSGHPGGHGHE